MQGEAGARQGTRTTRALLAIGQDVEAAVDDLQEELGAAAAAVEDDGDAALADERANLVEHRRQHLGEGAVGLGGDDEQRVAVGVIDPVVGGGGIDSRMRATWVFGMRRLPWYARTWPSTYRKPIAWPRAATRALRGRGRTRGALVAARRASLRRRVFTSGARSRPSRRPSACGECSLSASGRLMRNSAISSSVTMVVRRP